MADTVLICDDSVAVHRSLASYLKKEGINVISCFTGEDAINTIKVNRVDLVVLDIMLPGINGLEVCREIRRYNRKVYIIMLSAKGEVSDRVNGLETGSDDYVAKPFSPKEVSIKIRNCLSRMKSQDNGDTLYFEGLSINTNSYQAFYGAKNIDLTYKELGVLQILIKNAGRAVSRESIIEKVWGYDYDGDVRAVDSLMKRLKGKLKAVGISLNIKAVYGVGFRLDRSDEK